MIYDLQVLLNIRFASTDGVDSGIGDIAVWGGDLTLSGTLINIK